MARVRELDAKQEERERRDRRHYTPDLMGPVCNDPRCGLKLPKALAEAGFTTHPSCGPEAAQLRAEHPDEDARPW